MIQVLVTLLFLVAAFNTSLGLIILFGARWSAQTLLFFLFTLSVALWCVGIAMFYLSDKPQDMIMYAKIYYVSAATIGYTMLAFTLAYLQKKSSPAKIAGLLLPFFGIVGLSVMSNGLILGAEQGNEKSIILNPAVYPLYATYIVAYIYFAILLIGFYLLRAAKQKSAERFGLLYVFIALLVAGTFGVYFNLILPYVGDYSLVWVGPLCSIVMVGLIFASILRHRLFDVRLVIARTVGYVMLLFALALVYGSAVFVVSNLLFPENTMATEQYIANTVLAVFTAFSYQPLKRFFDKVTDRIFFRDAYDPQRVLDELSEVIVNRIELPKLANDSMTLMRTALKSSFAAIVLSENSSFGKKGHVFVDGEVGLKELPDFIEKFEHRRDATLYSEMDRESAEARFMKSHEIDMVLPLVASKKFLGCMLLGVKQNGGVYTSKDINFATIAVNEMAIAFLNAQRYEEIKAFSRTLESKIEEATKELKISNKKLHAIDKSKDEFISMASHQLRTPLTAVKGYVSMILDGDIGKISQEQREVLEQAFDSTQRMVFLIGDFLNVSRIQTGKFMLELADINLARLIPEEIGQLVDTARARKIEIKYEGQDSLPIIKADENKLRQVMMNFMDNAIYYSRPDSIISVRLYKDADDIVFKVIDTGIGVPKAEQAHLFTKFYRATNARQQRPDGTGIGLYMAKKVIVSHGGSVIFETKEGIGSTFGFKLPLKHHLEELKQHPDSERATANHGAR